jgi:inorganic phosphate transporter, PiT family
VSGSEIILIIVVVTGVSFDFTNGFHDTANAVATSIATGALKPRVAVGMSAVLNLVGAFLSISVAATIAKGIIKPSLITGDTGMLIVLAALVGAILWNLVTWYFTLPSSSSHALIGGVIGATIAAAGSKAVDFHALTQSVLAPAILSPFICLIVALLGTFVAYKMIRLLAEDFARKGYRYGQIGSAALVSLAHGTNDAQKTMGVITLALIADGKISAAHFYVPWWVKVVCACSIAAGTFIGGWRIINTMGNRVTEIESPQGFAAEAASGATILASSYYGYPLSTTQVVAGGVMGAGLGKKLASVHWGVVGQMVSAWVFTIPAAGVIGAGAWEVTNIFGDHGGAASIVVAAITAALAAVVFLLAQKTKVTADDLDRTHVSAASEGTDQALAPAGAAG